MQGSQVHTQNEVLWKGEVLYIIIIVKEISSEKINKREKILIEKNHNYSKSKKDLNYIYERKILNGVAIPFPLS